MRYKVLLCYAPLAICRAELASYLVNLSPNTMKTNTVEWVESENNIGVMSDPNESSYVFPDYMTRQYKDIFLHGGITDTERVSEFFAELFEHMTDNLESTVNFVVNSGDVAYLFEQLLPRLEADFEYADFLPYTIHMDIDHDEPVIDVINEQTVNHCDHYVIRQYDELPADEDRHANITSRRLKSTAMIENANATWAAVFAYTRLLNESYIAEMYNKLEILAPTEYEIQTAVADYVARNSKVSTAVAQSDLLDNLLR